MADKTKSARSATDRVGHYIQQRIVSATTDRFELEVESEEAHEDAMGFEKYYSTPLI